MSPFLVSNRDLDALLEYLRPGDLGLEQELDPLLGQSPLQGAGHLLVGKRSDGREQLHHRDLGAEAPPHAAHLEADRAGPDDHHLLGYLGEGQRLCRGHDSLAVELHERQLDRFGAHREADVAGLELGVGVVAVDPHAVLRSDHAVTGEDIDLVLLHQHRDALDQLLDDARLAGQHPLQIEGDAVGDHTVLGDLREGAGVDLAGLEQGLGRDAADVEAGAAEGAALLDQRDPEAELGRADGAHVAAGAGTDDHEVVGRGHAHTSSSRRSGSSMVSTIRLRKVTASRPSIRRWS